MTRLWLAMLSALVAGAAWELIAVPGGLVWGLATVMLP
jgi:hypothetical protein